MDGRHSRVRIPRNMRGILPCPVEKPAMSESQASYRVTYTDPAATDRALQREAGRLSATEAGRYTGPEPSLVRALMRRHGWSQVAVSETLRVDVSTVRRWCPDREQQQFSEIPFARWWLLLARAGVVTVDGLAGSAVPGRLVSIEDAEEIPIGVANG